MSRPIRWTIERVTTRKGRRSGRRGSDLIAITDADGQVTVQEDPSTLVFSATTSCGDETPLFLGLVAAFSASEGIRKDTGVISWVHWPNVVVIDGRMVARVSASVKKTKAEDGTERVPGRNSVEMRFSVNLLHNDELPDSTSIQDHIGVEVDRDLLLEKILESLAWMQFGWSHGMNYQLLRRIRSMTETIGREVLISLDGTEARGEARDIDPSGRLQVTLRDGRVVALTDGDELISN